MKDFLHFKKQKLELAMTRLIECNQLYINRSYKYDSNFQDLLETSSKFFSQFGDTLSEGTVSQLRINYDTALRGIDPIKLEKVKIGKRNIRWSSAFYCQEKFNELIKEILNEINKTLDNAEESIGQIILSALQSGIISESILNSSNSIEKIELLWNKLTENEQIGLIAKNLRLKVHEKDIFLLLEKVIQKIIL